MNVSFWVPADFGTEGVGDHANFANGLVAVNIDVYGKRLLLAQLWDLCDVKNNLSVMRLNAGLVCKLRHLAFSDDSDCRAKAIGRSTLCHHSLHASARVRGYNSAKSVLILC
jgi:hypothetical protein